MFALHLVHGMHPELFEEKVILIRAVSTEFESNCCLVFSVVFFLLEDKNKFAYA